MITIGTRGVVTIHPSVGPGSYSPEKGDSHVKPGSRATNFKSTTARVSPNPSPEPGPGKYHENSKDFGKKLSKVTIGVRRFSRSPEGPAPG